MSKPKIVAIVGSMRKDSYNRQLARLAKEAVGDRAEFELLEYADVPLMNEDIEYPTPESVQRVRQAVASADGVWFFTRPIEKGGSQVLAKKPAAISGISPGMSGTAIAQDHLVTLISILNMKVMNWPRLTIPNGWQQLDEEKKLKLASSAIHLQKQADAFVQFLQNQ